MKTRMTVLASAAVLALLAPSARAQPAESLRSDSAGFESLIGDPGLDGRLREGTRTMDHIGGIPSYPDSGYGYDRYDRYDTDCEKVVFHANGATASSPVRLESRFYRRVCDYNRTTGREECYDRYVGAERRDVIVEIEGRGEMYPWEKDEFKICLAGRSLNASTVRASHRYEFGLPNMREDRIMARAYEKTPTRPDSKGIGLRLFATGEGGFKAEFQDRWAQYYDAGEQTVLSLEVRRDVPHWADETVLEKEVVFSAQDSYSVELDPTEFRKAPKAGEKFFLKFEFKRVGRVSLPEWQGTWETVSVELGGSTSALK